MRCRRGSDEMRRDDVFFGVDCGFVHEAVLSDGVRCLKGACALNSILQ